MEKETKIHLGLISAIVLISLFVALIIFKTYVHWFFHGGRTDTGMILVNWMRGYAECYKKSHGRYPQEWERTDNCYEPLGFLDGSSVEKDDIIIRPDENNPGEIFVTLTYKRYVYWCSSKPYCDAGVGLINDGEVRLYQDGEDWDYFIDYYYHDQ